MQKLITIYTFTLPHQAYIIKGKLESEGIYCFLRDELTVQVDNFYSNAVGGVKLQVNAKDVKEAVEILKEGGFTFDDAEDESIILKKLDDLTSKIPFIRKRTLFVRLIMLALFITLIIIVINYLITGM